MTDNTERPMSARAQFRMWYVRTAKDERRVHLALGADLVRIRSMFPDALEIVPLMPISNGTICVITQ